MLNATYEQNAQEIQELLSNYFEGLFSGNTDLLKEVFHSEAMLTGDVGNKPYRKNIDEYLDAVKSRKSPKELGEKFRMKIMSIETTGNIGYARLHVPMLGFNYYDYISLARADGQWKIISKLFIHIDI